MFAEQDESISMVFFFHKLTTIIRLIPVHCKENGNTYIGNA
jgi:hypothetical protein